MIATTRTLARVLVLMTAAGAASEMRTAPPQNVANKANQTSVFTCGVDQSRNPIPVTAPNTILAGDSRFYIPCPGAGGHGPEHRENRESAELYEALQSNDPEIRWRAVQALVRISAPLEPITPQDQNVPIKQLVASPIVVQADGIGALTHSMLIRGACRAEAQVFDGASDAKRWQPGRFFVFLRDLPTTTTRPRTANGVILPPVDSNNPLVRHEAAYALGVRLSRPGLDENLMTAAARELFACFGINTQKNAAQDVDLANAGLILETIGTAQYARDDQITEAETFLVGQAHGPNLPILIGAVKGLEALYRQHGQYPIRQVALLTLRQLARYGAQSDPGDAVNADARVRRLALMALQAARDHDAATLRAASLDSDWQVRRLVAGSLNLSDPEQVRLAEILRQDSAFQVRYDLLSPVSQQVRQSRLCAPLLPYFKDFSPAVVMHAMDSLVESCTDLDEPIARLIAVTDVLAKPEAVYDWHVVARALAALARVKPDAAQDPLVLAAKHEVWQVRATAAAASVDAKNEAIAIKLARDKEPNVQTAALDALFRMHSVDVVPAAIAVLSKSEDYQAVRMAAMVLKGLPAESKDEASDALLTALRVTTAHESDTSRDSRIAIIERLAETLDPGRSFLLVPFATDFDDAVNLAIAKTLAALGSFVPGNPSLKRRYPYQPTDYEGSGMLNALPKTANLELDEGVVTLKLLTDVAPVTVARFAEMANRGYYNGLTFHRVFPNFFVQGGSPGANDYVGTSRYLRDEVGPQGVHVRGAVGMSTRGVDRGDGQFFIDLVDVPQFDRDYTVFAYVTVGMPLVDKLLEGAVIRGVSVR